MIRAITGIAAAAALALVLTGGTAPAQKPGGILRMYDPDSPGGLSIQEEATVYARGPMVEAALGWACARISSRLILSYRA